MNCPKCGKSTAMRWNPTTIICYYCGELINTSKTEINQTNV